MLARLIMVAAVTMVNIAEVMEAAEDVEATVAAGTTTSLPV